MQKGIIKGMQADNDTFLHPADIARFFSQCYYKNEKENNGMEKKTLLQVRVHKQKGFKPIVRFGAWRIAMSNAAQDECAVEMSRHLETDESFILLDGACTLLVAGGQESYGPVHAVSMRPQAVYNVPKGTWHAHLMRAGAKLLIVENDGTSAANSERIDVTAEETLRLESLAAHAVDVVQDVWE